MERKDKLISIITVVRNDVSHISSTIESVLSQSYPSIEYIVIDGASTDGTKEVIEKYADCMNYWKSEPDKGVYDAMNKGIALSTGDFVYFLNSGDTLLSSTTLADMHLEQVEDKNTIVYGNVLAKYWDGEYVEKPMPFFDTCMKFKGIGINHQTMFFPGDVIRHFMYDLRFRIAADYDMAYRMWKQGIKFLYRDVTVARYEWGNGISSNPNKLLDVYRENAQVCHQEWSPLYWLKMMLEHYRLWKKRKNGLQFV